MTKHFLLVLALLIGSSSTTSNIGSDPPLTEEERYLQYPKERYGICYPYCLEEAKLYTKAVWNTISLISDLREQLYSCQVRNGEISGDLDYTDHYPYQ